MVLFWLVSYVGVVAFVLLVELFCERRRGDG